jgi:hypothetical protein
MDFMLPLVGGILLMVVCFVGLTLSTGALRLALRQRRLDRDGVEAQAEVIRHRKTEVNRFFTYRLTVGDKTYVREEVSDDQQPPIGSAVIVRYLPDQPRYNIVSGDTPYARLYRGINPLMVGLLSLMFILVGLAGLWLILNLGG